MIKVCFKKLFYPSILFIFLLSLLFFSFFLLANRDSHDSLTKKRPSFSLSSLSSLLNNGIYYRVARDSLSFQTETPLLLGSLFPSGSLLNFWRDNELSKADLKPLVIPANLTVPSPTEDKFFRQEIIFQDEDQRLRLSAPSSKFLMIDQSLSLLREHLESRKPVKPKGKLIINARHPHYCFPVSWPFFFREDFGDPREGNRLHLGIDIFAEEGTEVYAITDGVIQQATTLNKAGNTLLLRGKDGKGYTYMHLQGLAKGIREGKAVKKGELIAYVGHTGTISSAPHLHFQVHADQSFSKDSALNPYEALVSLCQGRGVTDLGSPKPHFSQARGLRQKTFSSGTFRREYFLLGKKPTSIKSTLIEVRDGGPSFPKEAGLVWRIPNPTWKLPRAKFLVPTDDSETIPSSPQVARNWPKRKSAAKVFYP